LYNAEVPEDSEGTYMGLVCKPAILSSFILTHASYPFLAPKPASAAKITAAMVTAAIGPAARMAALSAGAR